MSLLTHLPAAMPDACQESKNKKHHYFMRLDCCLIDLEVDHIFNISKLLDCSVGQPLCVRVCAGIHMSFDLGSCCWSN